MTVQPDIPHKVSQIRHDLDDLYELMSRVEKSQALVVGVLEQHDNRFEELQQTLNLHGGRLDGMDGRLDRIEDNQHRMDGRMDAVDGRLGGVDGRLDRIEDNQHQQFEHLSAQMAEILGVLRGPAAADPAPEHERY